MFNIKTGTDIVFPLLVNIKTSKSKLKRTRKKKQPSIIQFYTNVTCSVLEVGKEINELTKKLNGKGYFVTEVINSYEVANPLLGLMYGFKSVDLPKTWDGNK